MKLLYSILAAEAAAAIALTIFITAKLIPPGSFRLRWATRRPRIRIRRPATPWYLERTINVPQGEP